MNTLAYIDLDLPKSWNLQQGDVKFVGNDTRMAFAFNRQQALQLQQLRICLSGKVQEAETFHTAVVGDKSKHDETSWIRYADFRQAGPEFVDPERNLLAKGVKQVTFENDHDKIVVTYRIRRIQ